MTRRRVRMSSGVSNIITPVIIIRLVGRSMRSQAVSTRDIGTLRSLLRPSAMFALLMRGRMPARPRGRQRRPARPPSSAADVLARDAAVEPDQDLVGDGAGRRRHLLATDGLPALAADQHHLVLVVGRALR